ncbi:hypothetical protein [Pedobacter soli]|uniref:Uncharacterized protein n=1 Tax=Pedobacter soli TaxID=390242 RepID=A0A1G6U8N8_9SPHI|nr:hypothetical protein [Pedobacter soli]SDD37641.1 hypothetical protein SAMN04488024_105270 [Pedobacter soli]
MKNLLLLVVVLFASGCLIPGAPHYYHYKLKQNNADSVVVISYPSRLDYQYRFSQNVWDSVLVFDPIHRLFQKMTLHENADFYPKAYYSLYKKERSNLQKMNKVKSLVVKKYKQNLAETDTLYYQDLR